MITYISEANARKYQQRFDKAVSTLQSKYPSGLYNDLSIGSLEEYFGILKNLASLTDVNNPDLGRFFTMLPLDEGLFTIDANSRKITVPSEFVTNGVGVNGDEMAEVVYFSIDRFFDAIDLARDDMNIAIQWEANGEAGVSRNYVKDLETIPGKIIFGWPISNELTKKAGTIKFAVRFYMIGVQDVTVDGVTESVPALTYSFSTLPAEIKVNSTLDYDLYSTSALEVLNYNDVLVDRIKNSVSTDPSIPAPSPARFIVNLGTDASYTVEKDPTTGEWKWEEYNAGLDSHTKIMDLNDPSLPLKAQATGINVGYDWKKRYYLNNGVLSNNTVSLYPASGTYYELASLAGYTTLPTDADIHFFTKTTENEVEVYTPYVAPSQEHYTIDSEGVYRVDGEVVELYIGKDSVPQNVNYAAYYEADLTDGIKEDWAYYKKINDSLRGEIYTDAGDLSNAEVYRPEDPDAPINSVLINTSDPADAIVLYERFTTLNPDDAGLYSVDAITRAGLKESRTASAKVLIPAPQQPSVQVPAVEDGIFDDLKFTDDNGDITINAITNGERQVSLPVKVRIPELAADANPDVVGENPQVTVSYQWYAGETTFDDNGNIVDIYDAETHTFNNAQMIEEQSDLTTATVAEDGELTLTLPTGKDDMLCYAKVTSNRNNHQASDFTYRYRVTPAPQAPRIKARGVEQNYQKADGTANVIPLTWKVANNNRKITVSIDKTNVQSDEYFYLWMKRTMSEADWNGDTLRPEIDLDGVFGFNVGTNDDGDIVASEGHSLDSFIKYLDSLPDLEFTDPDGYTGYATLEVKEPGYYYCIVINKLNNNIAINISPFFNIVN